jgi:hypothetical protein
VLLLLDPNPVQTVVKVCRVLRAEKAMVCLAAFSVSAMHLKIGVSGCVSALLAVLVKRQASTKQFKFVLAVCEPPCRCLGVVGRHKFLYQDQFKVLRMEPHGPLWQHQRETANHLLSSHDFCSFAAQQALTIGFVTFLNRLLVEFAKATVGAAPQAHVTLEQHVVRQKPDTFAGRDLTS